ncbi:hypothetical protein HPB47_006498 [Ixodes persulcatus]|uniref:Uncharacterized protein n=1 Tax=Ixodes persulcatus TaxID=34615 RepID=A0AC60P9W3_IXOPE|nr:hypothetical protein HPB47_006498 [Ixodes persulcatus]
MSYAKRKEVEITTAVVTQIRTGIRAVYDTGETSTTATVVQSQLSPDKCDSCMSWEKNLRSAYGKCASFQERCQVLTLLPPHLTVKYVQGFIPEATKYVIQKAKKLTDAGGVWSPLEPYSRCKPTSPCFHGKCDQCPRADKLTLEKFDIGHDEEVVFATWESGELIKKTLTAAAFIKELQKTVMKWIPHNYLRRVQAKAIHDEKQSCERGALVFHFDFAEN